MPKEKLDLGRPRAGKMESSRSWITSWRPKRNKGGIRSSRRARGEEILDV